MLDSEAKRYLGRKTPPVDDSWRPNHKRGHKKPYGLTTYTRISWRLPKREFFEFTTWYATEKDRDNAIIAANKAAEHGKYSVPVAMAKVQR